MKFPHFLILLCPMLILLKNNLFYTKNCLLILKIKMNHAPSFVISSLYVTSAVSSDQIDPRHTKGTAYRCFLPDLTRFTGFHCVGPSLQHHLQKSDYKLLIPKLGIQSCCSGLQVTGHR